LGGRGVTRFPELSGERSRLRRWNRIRLLRRLPRHSIGAEIGVWKGDFSAQILKTVDPEKLYLVDSWSAHERSDLAVPARPASKIVDQATRDELHAQVLDRFRLEIEGGRIEVIRADSAEAAARFADASLDWIYLDADHRYEHVREDLRRFLPKLKRDGLIAGDDYDVDGWWGGGVTRAVDELAATHPWTMRRVGRSQFILKRRNAFDG
jgi:methyltransferase family protein